MSEWAESKTSFPWRSANLSSRVGTFRRKFLDLDEVRDDGNALVDFI